MNVSINQMYYLVMVDNKEFKKAKGVNKMTA